MSKTMSPSEDKVSTDDVLTFEEVQKVKEGKEGGAADAAVMDFLKKKFDESPELADEFLNDHEKFTKKYITGETQEETPEVTPEEQEAQEEVKEDTPAEKPAPTKDEAEDIDVNLKLKPEWLGSYAKNREPEDAVLEALKGNKKKDEYIETLKDEKTRLLDELDAARKKSRTTTPAPKPKTARKFEYPVFDEDEDVYSDEYQAKFKKYVSTSNQERAALNSEVDELRNLVHGIKDTTDTEAEESRQKRAVLDEFNEIDRLRKNNTDVFNYERPIKEIENDYIEFVDRIRKIAGIQEPLYAPMVDSNGSYVKDEDGNFVLEVGRFHPKVSEAYQLYQDEVDGKEFRQKCEDRDVRLPEDIEELFNSYKIRGIRSEVMKETGGTKPISYLKALKLYRQDVPSLEETKMKAKMEGHKSHAKAVSNRGNFAKETSTQQGAQPIDLSKYTVDDLKAALAKEDKSDSDKEFIRTVYKSQGISDKEIDTVLAKPSTGSF